MPTLNADVKLRNKVAAVEGTVILIGAGHVDRVIRFTKLPECLEAFKTKVIDGTVTWPVLLNLDRGPDQEAWAQAKRETFVTARRDRPVAEPLPVSAKNSEGWSVDAEDVPVVEIETKDKVDEESGVVCETCTVKFNTAKALDIHKARAKHF